MPLDTKKKSRDHKKQIYKDTSNSLLAGSLSAFGPFGAFGPGSPLASEAQGVPAKKKV